MPPVDAVLFDLDDTLVSYRREGGEVLAAAFERAGVEPCFGIEAYYERYADYLDGADTIAAQRAACFADLARERGYDPEAGRAVAAAFEAIRDHANVRVLPGAERAVRALAAGHDLAVVTNGAPGMQRRKLDALDCADAFETVVHGGFDAPAKPDPAPFERALDALDASATRAVHVGNSLASDVAGARAAGLGAAWLRADGVEPDPEPDYVIESLAELQPPPWER